MGATKIGCGWRGGVSEGKGVVLLGSHGLLGLDTGHDEEDAQVGRLKTEIQP